MVGQALNLKVEGSKLWIMEASPSYHIRAFLKRFTFSTPYQSPLSCRKCMDSPLLAPSTDYLRCKSMLAAGATAMRPYMCLERRL